ncbi:MAG TPA: GNAT family N-acetyltransferase [Solirubrobacterales bacterium]|jgi:GNAT superfamily N-acetyltransferase
MSATIREARPGEEERILPMFEWLFEPPGATPPKWDLDHARAVLTDAITGPGSMVLLAEDGDRMVGFCTAYMTLESIRFGLRCWVEELVVDPERRSEGIGAGLLVEAQRWAAERKATHLKLDSGIARVDAHRFYEQEGATWKSYSYSWLL